LEALLARDDIDAVSVCTIEPAHLEPVVKAAGAGKHILLEKPMAANLENAGAMCSAVDEAGVKLMIAHLFRLHARCCEVKNAIEAGRIGDVVSREHRIRETPFGKKHPQLIASELARRCEAL